MIKIHRLIIKIFNVIQQKITMLILAYVNQGLEQAINDGKQSKVASQQQSKEVDNSQDSNANNNLPSQSLTKRYSSLNKSDQTSQREIVNETIIEKVQPQQKIIKRMNKNHATTILTMNKK